MTKPWPVAVDASTEGDDAGFLTKCEYAWHKTDATVIGYLHSDLYIHEYGFDDRVLEAFADDRVAVVGFVGATGLGHEDIYKVPYDFRQLARYDVWSNLTDYEIHGRRETNAKQVAVIDSCAVFVRRSLLVRLGGWPTKQYPNSSHCSDLWISCMAARQRLHVVMAGVACTHSSGGRGTAGEDWLNQRGGDREAFHQPAHQLIYEDFRDVLPIRV